MDIAKLLKETQDRYNEEYKVQDIMLLTEEQEGKTLFKRYKVTDREYLIGRGYEEHKRKTYMTTTYTLKPKTFRTAQEIYAEADRIERLAHRTVEVDEMNLILKTLARGKSYDIVCILDTSEELKPYTKWGR